MKRLTMVLLLAARGFGEVPESVQTAFALDGFYAQAVVIEGFPIVASGKVSAAAMQEAKWIVSRMLEKRPDLLRELAKNKVRLAVMAVEERTVDVPEHSDLEPVAFWNRRARGLGATRERPAVSCGEENLLCHPGDPYPTENLLVHEFAHAVHEMGVNTLDESFDGRLEKVFRRAMAKGLWKNTYAATNHREYWAEAVQSWFGTNRQNDDLHNEVDTREELVNYDPGVAKLCAEVFGENEWHYTRPDDPSRVGMAHLAGLDRARLRPFAWTEAEEAAADWKRK